MAKGGLAAGLAKGFSSGLRLGMQARENRLNREERNKAREQAGNKLRGEANKAYMDSLNKYTMQKTKLETERNKAENETQRNSISKAISSLDSQFASISNTASTAGVKTATDFLGQFQPEQYDELKRINVGGKDFTVSSAVYDDFINNKDMYGLSDDGRNIVTKQLKSDAPLAGKEPEYAIGVVDRAMRSDMLFKESKLSKSNYEIYRANRLKENGNLTENEILREFNTKPKEGSSGVADSSGKRTGSAGERDRNEWSELTTMKAKGEELSIEQEIRLRSFNKTFDFDTYAKNTAKGNIGKAQEIFDKGFINNDWSKQDKNKAQVLEAQILKGTDQATKKQLTDKMATATANNLVINQGKKIIELIGSGKGEKGAEKGIIKNAVDGVKKHLDAGALSDKQAKELEKVIRLNTRTGYLMATYIKLISGTAAGEKEVARLADMIIGGKNVTETTIKSSIKEFTNIASESNKQVLKDVKDYMPKSAMSILGVRGNSKKKDENKPAKKSKYKAGQRARQDGVLFEFDGSKWNKVKE